MLVFPALAFAGRLIHLWTVVSIRGGGMWLVWVVAAKRLRRYTISTDALTILEFWEAALRRH